MNILALAGDAGGARALEPVIARLRRDHAVETRAYGPATDSWARAGFAPRPPEPVTLDGVDRVLLGTSVNAEQWELEFARAARSTGVPSVAVTDAWSHLRERFLDRTGRLTLPDRIAVPDEAARQELIEIGAAATSVVTTGHTGLDGLWRLKADVAGRRAAVRSDLGLGSARCVTFASQPLSELTPREDLGFDEREALADVIRAVAAVGCAAGVPIVLLLKWHPREAARATGSAPPGISVRNAPSLSLVDLAAVSDLIIGMNSMLLMEMCLLGVPVLSYQPGLRITDPLPSNRLGWSRAVYRREALEVAVSEELLDDDARARRAGALARARMDDGAVDRVIRLLFKATVKEAP